MKKSFRKSGIAFLLIVIMVALAGLFTACTDNPDPSGTGDKCTVTFYVDGSVYATREVSKNKRISDVPADPAFDDGRIFTAWYKNADCTGDAWVFETGVVAADMGLYAGTRQVSAYPTDLAMKDEAVTSTIVWTQKAKGESYTVTLTDANGTETALSGAASFDATACLVTFVPEKAPQGGEYSVKVVDGAYPDNAATADNLMFCGDGSQGNPYLVATAKDFEAVNLANVDAGVYFELYANITVDTTRADQKAFTFNGNLFGSGKTITLGSANCGAIYRIGAQGSVASLSVAGNLSTSSNDSVGALADYNEGKIEKVSVSATVTSTAGTVGSSGLETMLDESAASGRGIAGGVVGTNEATGTVSDCTISSAMKVAIAGGGIVGYNKGSVVRCENSGTIGAANSLEAGGKTLSAYSYCGGIVGVNAGSVTESTLSGKMLAQRYLVADYKDTYAGTTNSYFGGIAGLNTSAGTISASSFTGIRIHADEYVGGIAGQNDGVITDCFAVGVYKTTTGNPSYAGVNYVGGRTNVGGIAGGGTGSVVNSITTVNVYCYVENTAYAVAPGAVTNCVYLATQPNDSASYQYDTTSSNPTSVSLLAPEGATNVAVSEPVDGTSDVNLAESYLTTVNGNNKFSYNGTTIVLVLTEVEELTTEVTLYDGDTVIGTKTVSESAATIAAPAKSGLTFVGWSLTKDGEVKYEAKTPISYYDVKDVEALYAVYETKVADTAVVIAVWHGTESQGYLPAEDVAKIKAGFEAYLTEKGYDLSTLTIEFRDYSGNVATCGAAVNADGDVDAVLGGNSMSSVTTLSKKAFTSEVFTALGLSEKSTSRYCATLTDNTLAAELFTYLTVAPTTEEPDDPDDPTEEYDLVVAIHASASKTTYITDEEIEALKTAFVAYLTEKGMTNVKINWVVLKAMAGGDFNTEVTTNYKDADFVIGGNTITSSTPALVESNTGVREGIFANTTRKCAILAGAEQNVYAQALLTYLTVDPSAGGDEPDQPTDPTEEYDLVVVIHASASSSTYITDEEIEALKTAFVAYLTEKGMTNVKINWVVVKAVNGAGFNTEVTTNYKDADFVIGGNTITSSTPALVESNTGVREGIFANTTRKCAILAGAEQNVYAQALLTYLTVDPSAGETGGDTTDPSTGSDSGSTTDPSAGSDGGSTETQG